VEAVVRLGAKRNHHADREPVAEYHNSGSGLKFTACVPADMLGIGTKAAEVTGRLVVSFACAGLHLET
jgi:hypothetical protein